MFVGLNDLLKDDVQSLYQIFLLMINLHYFLTHSLYSSCNVATFNFFAKITKPFPPFKGSPQIDVLTFKYV